MGVGNINERVHREGSVLHPAGTNTYEVSTLTTNTQ